MKNAFITFYELLNDHTVEVNNGFSFILNHIEGDHFLINIDYDRDELRRRLSSYDRVYLSVTYTDHLFAIVEMVDERWVVGGQLFENLSSDYWKAILKPAVVYSGYFEDYLGIKRDDTFTSYWESTVFDKDPLVLRYNAVCGRSCYWKRCKYCAGHLFHEEKSYERDVVKVLSRLPDSNLISIPYLYCGSMPPSQLKKVIQYQQSTPKRRTLYQILVRFDDPVYKVIEEAEDLTNFILCVGVEGFSQQALDILDRNLKVDTLISTMELAAKKGSKITAFLMSRVPFMTKAMADESIETIRRMADRIPALTQDNLITLSNAPLVKRDTLLRPDIIKESVGMAFFDSLVIEWPTEEVAAQFGPYVVEEREASTYFKKSWRNEKRILSVLSPEVEESCLRVTEELKKHFLVGERKL
jgi:hypothetical protein